jgi:hypothetical protein
MPEPERGERRTPDHPTGQDKGTRDILFLETFNALCCLIRKVDTRTLNAKSAFHVAA